MTRLSVVSLLSVSMLVLAALACQRSNTAIGGPSLEEIQVMQLDRSVPGHETIPDAFDALKLTKAQSLALVDSVATYGAQVTLEAEEFEVWYIKNRVLPALDTMSDSIATVMLARLEQSAKSGERRSDE